VVGDVEEVAGAQVGVALLVVRVEARRVDRQFDRGCLVQLEGAVVALKRSFYGRQAPEVGDVELDA
jgi:hypothetical protein